MSKAQRIINRRVLVGFTVAICLLVMRGVWSLRYSSYEFDNRLRNGLSNTFSSLSHMASNDTDYIDASTTAATDGKTEHPPCYYLPGAEEVLVVMKTSAIESRKKIPVHLTTTFQCTPNFVIYSDMEESILDQPIYDVLQEYDATTRKSNKDFRVYDSIQLSDKGENQKVLSDIASDPSKLAGLDRWKYLPMVTKALQHSPSAKWYIFLDTSTALMWSNLLLLLAKMDSTKPFFLGNRLYLDEVGFASGGAGIILSNAAVRQFHGYGVNTSFEDFEVSVKKHREGDLILSLALNGSGVGMDQMWPNLQGETPVSLDYTERQWCYAPVTYHGMSITQLKAMWNVEQDFIEEKNAQEVKPFLHRDAYKQFVAPLLPVNQHDWDNSCNQVVSPSSLQEQSGNGCWAACMDTEGCVQWWYSKDDKECRIAKEVRLGRRSDCSGCVAGWIGERVEALKKKLDEQCDGKQGWVVPAQGFVGGI